MVRKIDDAYQDEKKMGRENRQSNIEIRNFPVFGLFSENQKELLLSSLRHGYVTIQKRLSSARVINFLTNIGQPNF